MKQNECQCGCGGITKLGNSFVHGHNMRGKHHSEEAKKEIALAKQGSKNPMFGKHHSEKSKEKCRQSNLGKHNHPCSEEAKRKMAISKMGKKNPMFDIHIVGSKHYNWKGGISKLPYSQDWTETLKKAIRQRDDYTCQLCSKPQKQERRKLSVHHIDYNKENCNPTNLITLCDSCNIKVNQGRSKWTEFFRLRLKLRKAYVCNV